MNIVDQILRYVPFDNPIFIIMVILFVVFLGVFSTKTWAVGRMLDRVITALEARKRENITNIDPRQLENLFEEKELKHLWAEYTDTIHPIEIATDESLSVLEYRSSLPAEMLFTTETLVNGPVGDDVWRHFPGVLTGLGIIGTFSGLIQGLSGFKASVASNANNAVAGLGPLFESVVHAFGISAIAISGAMLVVALSRIVVARLNAKVEKLCQAIDAIYQSGAGEVYLQRLVKASEQSEVHSAQLKDALVGDLDRLLTNLTERQIAAQMAAQQQLGETVSRSIAEAIAEPMERVRQVMEHNVSGQSSQVNSMLETMLTSFMAKLEGTFGGQINGINEQMQRSMAAMGAVQDSLQKLVQDIQKANEHATSHMSDKLAEAMQTASANQQQLTAQMTQFVSDFRGLITEEQRKSAEVMDQAIAGLLGEVNHALANMDASRRSAAVEEISRNKALTEQTGQLVAGLSTQIEDLLRAVGDQVLKTQENISAVREVSMRAIDGMNQGALTMGAAAQQFETAGQTINTVLNDSGQLVEQIRASSHGLQTASLALNNGFEKYDASRQSVQEHILTLNGLIEVAKREAGLSQQLMESMEASVRSLRATEEQSQRNLQEINDHLVSAFETFGNALVNQVQRVVQQTDQNISGLASQLTGVVQELAAFVQQTQQKN